MSNSYTDINDLLLLYNPHVVFYIIFVMTHFYYKLTEIELFNTFFFKIGDYYLLYKNLWILSDMLIMNSVVIFFSSNSTYLFRINSLHIEIRTPRVSNTIRTLFLSSAFCLCNSLHHFRFDRLVLSGQHQDLLTDNFLHRDITHTIQIFISDLMQWENYRRQNSQLPVTEGAPPVITWSRSLKAKQEELEAYDKVGTLMSRHVFFGFIIDR